jgi:fermentation-respiration switch protein FrsA (DUF1100 family)
MFISRRSLVVPVLLVCALFAGCTNLFFQPMHGLLLTPDRVGLIYEDVYVASADGVQLHAWFLPAQGEARGTVFFLHGNAENISTHLGYVYWLPARGFNVFLLDYRGYGLSQGAPFLAGVLDDVDAGFKALLARPDVDRERIVVLGQSLGGSLAAYYVAHTPLRSYVRALAIESTFPSYRYIAREKFGSFWITWPLQYPLSWTIDDDYSPINVIKQISPIPLLVIHGDADDIVPVHHGRRLYEEAREPKEWWLVPGGGHTQAFRRAEFRDRFVAYLTRTLCRQGPAYK